MVTQTAPGLRAMTPEYASPEQIRGERITTASDVYSLGVLLYELLTGTKPYRLNTRTTDEISRAITDQEPQRPSAVIASPRAALNGDLDNIVLMALRKEPARRYATVGQFSEDIRRYLEGRPVVAHSDTLSYRAGKFVRRNKVGVAAAAIVLLSLVAGIIATAWQAQNARSQRDLAQRERAKAEHINRFLQEMLGSSTPEAKGMDVKVSDLLGEASRRARIELATEPEVMASVLMTLGRTGVSIGTFGRAEADLRAAVEASVKSSGELHPTTASSMAWLSLALSYVVKNEEGIRVGRRAVELLRQLYPGGHEDLGVALYSTGLNLQESGDAKAAEVCLVEAVAVIKRYFGEQHGYHLATLGALGLAVESAGRFDEAEALYREAVAKGRGVEGRFRIFLAQASATLGSGLTNKGRYREAAEPLAEAEAIYREIFGDTNPSIA
jgi:serine/threonine-protein kinase